MSFSPKYVIVIVIIYIQAESIVEACHNAQHVRPTSALEISGRRRRDASEYNETWVRDADPELSEFFTSCMRGKTGKMFNSWRSVIDFVLRDTLWFEATDAVYCGDRKDTVKCWQRRLNFLLKSSSELNHPASDCIAEYDRMIKDEYGFDFELHYHKYYESYEYEPAEGEFKRWKRNIYGDVFGTAQKIIQDINDNLDIKFTTERTFFVSETTPTKAPSDAQPTPLIFPQKTCPAFSLILYTFCITNNIAQLITTKAINDYPSLEYFDETSNAKFITDHYSSCRITQEDVAGTTRFIENCYTSSEHQVFKRSFPNRDWQIPSIINIDPCLILDYPEIVRRNSPVYQTVAQCSEEISEDEAETTQEITTTSRPFKKPSKAGRIGKCEKSDHWTKWYDETNPNDVEGDFETLESLQKIYPGQICDNPVAIDARTAPYHRYHSGTNDHLFLSPEDGLRCFNVDQEDGKCENYKVKFCCKFEEPSCDDDDGYEWTKWLSRDSTKYGDDESLSKHIVETKNRVCRRPIHIRARIKANKKPYWKGLNILDISPQIGLICKNSDQKTKRKCRNYEVSFCCPE